MGQMFIVLSNKGITILKSNVINSGYDPDFCQDRIHY